MHSSALVIGYVVEAFEETFNGKTSKSLVVETRNTEKWKDFTVCRFSGEAGKYAEKAKNGDLVEVVGSPRSRNSNGRWYTNFEARYLEVKTLVPPAQQSLPDAAPSDGDLPF